MIGTAPLHGVKRKMRNPLSKITSYLVEDRRWTPLRGWVAALWLPVFVLLLLTFCVDVGFWRPAEAPETLGSEDTRTVPPPGDQGSLK